MRRPRALGVSVRRPASASDRPHVPAPITTELGPGDEALVTDGESAGLRGIIRGDGFPFGPIPTLRVELPFPLGERHIRVDFLRRAA